ncbi:hypothetical protein J1614_008479 [Plenodomus biglobosus]|nr:hypothetical protein J1614_008479 [Plenodomus biglobosus]
MLKGTVTHQCHSKWVRLSKGLLGVAPAEHNSQTTLTVFYIAPTSPMGFFGDARVLPLERAQPDDQKESKHADMAMVAACRVLKSEDGSS